MKLFRSSKPVKISIGQPWYACSGRCFSGRSYRKKYGSDENFDVIVNTTSGDLELWRVREIVTDGEVTDEQAQISISEALAIDEDYEVGEECYEQLELEEFGRRAIMAARQTLDLTGSWSLEKDEIFKRYTDRV